MCRALDIVNNIVSSYEELQNEIQENRIKLSNTDKEICDILHEIELTSFNACEGWKMAKEIQRLRQERRIFKDNEENFTLINSSIGHLKRSVSSFKKELKRVELKQEENIHRKYTPRIRTDLKVVRLQSAK